MNYRKTEQLRLRITKAQREGLEKLAALRAKGETISEVVRSIVAAAIASNQSSQSVLPVEVHDRLQKLCAEISRPKNEVIADCISGIWDLVETDRTPLVVEEVRLRRRYRIPAAAAAIAPRRRQPKRATAV